ncbi:MAG: SEFIR domain-containing protein, partial [Gammaproteobacteria bacterium]
CQQLIEVLQKTTNDIDLRGVATGGLGRIGGAGINAETICQQLIEVLQETAIDADLYEIAIDGLGQIAAVGINVVAICERLIAILQENKFGTNLRYVAANRLAKIAAAGINSAAISQLLTTVLQENKNDTDLRKVAANRVAQIAAAGINSEAICQQLINFLQDTANLVDLRQVVAKKLGRIAASGFNSEAICQQLIAILQETANDSDLRGGAIDGLGKIGAAGFLAEEISQQLIEVLQKKTNVIYLRQKAAKLIRQIITTEVDPTNAMTILALLWQDNSISKYSYPYPLTDNGKNYLLHCLGGNTGSSVPSTLNDIQRTACLAQVFSMIWGNIDSLTLHVYRPAVNHVTCQLGMIVASKVWFPDWLSLVPEVAVWLLAALKQIAGRRGLSSGGPWQANIKRVIEQLAALKKPYAQTTTPTSKKIIVPLGAYSRMLIALTSWQDEAQIAFQFIGNKQANGKLLAEHQALQRQISGFFSKLTSSLHEFAQQIEQIKHTFNQLLLTNLEQVLTALKTNLKQETQVLLQTAQQLKPPLKLYHVNLMQEAFNNLNTILTGNNRAYIQAKAERKIFKEQLMTLYDFLSINPTSLNLPVPATLRIFISYSWGIAANVKRVHRLAKDLKSLGFDVKLDIWHNVSGSVPVFLEYINNTIIVDKRQVRADVILVMCSEDLKEKWDNYVTSGKSRLEQDAGDVYRGHVVAKEIEQIQYRDNQTQAKKNEILPILLSGTNNNSAPSFLQPKATSALAMTNNQDYYHALFAIVQTIYDYEANIKKQTEELYKVFNTKRAELATDTEADLLSNLPAKAVTKSSVIKIGLFRQKIDNANNTNITIDDYQMNKEMKM